MSSLIKYLPLAMDQATWKRASDELRLVAALMADRRVPIYAKAVPGLAAAYLFSPIDLIPGVIPLLGQLDDLAVVLLAIQTFKRLIPPALLAEHEARLGIVARPG